MRFDSGVTEFTWILALRCDTREGTGESCDLGKIRSALSSIDIARVVIVVQPFMNCHQMIE